ncbi:MAG: 16S rRNA (guanine(966)-N(2))-methyltransferase RsmD [Deltaproteobacteria bacterium]|nr:16S rRNA (guanine(966)-N(2))-methyltransferase RsmD [Deltaproteobacteria bacterium]
MRIVSGRFKGKRLTSPKGMDIRPTSDKVRESIFNILPREFPFKRALDLFAGTGAMGLEALSRGAEEATFVDSGVEAISLIRKNLESCGAEARIYKSSVQASLKQFSRKGEKFDLIIIDPPYSSTLLREALEAIDRDAILADEGVIVAETTKRMALEADLKSLELFDERRYGDTVVYFLKNKVVSEN